MITKMKKLLLFMSNSAVDADVTLLGQLGVMHVKPFQPAKDESIDRVNVRIKQLEKAIGVLDRFEGDSGLSSTEVRDFSAMERGEIALMEAVLNIEDERILLENQKEEQINAINWYEKWGSILVDDITELTKKGISLKLYELDDRELKSVRDREDIHVVSEKDNLSQVVLVSNDVNEQLDFTVVEVPQVQQETLKVLLAQTMVHLSEKEAFLQKLCAQKAILSDALVERVRRLDVRNMQYGGISIDKQVQCWEGYIPVDAVDKLIEVADKNSWGYVVEDPTAEEADEVPTLIRSSRWAERVRPVMNFMGLVPGYSELDVSKVFMVFFTFFTGVLVGDAGYGLVFLLITFLVHKKQKFKRIIEFDLMYTLSVSIMFWGVLTGTYFGAEAIAEISVLSKLRVDKLASFGGDNVFIQSIMFLIGAIHLSVAHLQVAWKYINSVKAIAQIGWVAIVWGLYFMVNQMVLGNPAPAVMLWLFVGGMVLIALFSNPGPNFFKGMLSSIGNLPLSIINGFSDVISYIRLYAVGLSTVLMAASFNEMAIGDGVSTVLSGVGAVLILVLGHGLNMILAAMAVLVHGVRLNMLEYSGHAGVEFSGSEYNPFKIKK